MGQYRYTVYSSEGVIQRGRIRAQGEDEAKQLLWNKGMTIVSLRQAEKADTTDLVKVVTHNRVTVNDLIDFAQRFATLLSAGIPLMRSLQMLGDQSESRQLGQILRDIAQEVSGGSPLYIALSKYPKVFASAWIHIVKSGELTGQLALSLAYISEYLENQRTMRQKVVTALAYPGVLCSVTILTVWFLLYKIVPKFAAFYADFGNVQLPLLTQKLIDFSNFLQQYFFLMVGAILLGIYILSQYAKTEIGRWQMDMFRLRLPVVGRLIYYAYLERFTANLEVLLRASIPLLTAMEAMEGLFSGSPIFSRAIGYVREQVAEGETLSKSLTETKVFPILLTNMIGVGEESGKMSDVLLKVNKYYRFQIEMLSARMSAMLEPIIIITMGGVIGVILLALYLPIFKLASATGAH